MSKSMTKKEKDRLIVFLICAGIIWGIGRILNNVGVVVPSVICIAGFWLFFWYRQQQKKVRILYLRKKYADENLAQRIFQHQLWIGQTSEQLIDARGNPHCIDKKVMKTRKRETWKYNKRGVNRYDLRITLDDDRVTEWDQKS